MEISFSLINNYRSNEDAIRQVLKVSKSYLKKFDLSKKWLRFPGKAASVVKVPIDLASWNMINPVYDGPSINIISQDEHFLAFEKPIGIHSHPHRYSDTNNVLSFMRANGYHDLLKVNGEAYDRGLLYRLDLETSGVLLYAKDETTHRYVRDNYGSVVVQKSYLAIVKGAFDREGEHTFYYRGAGVDKHLVKVSEVQIEDSQPGSLAIKRVDYNSTVNCSLLSVELVTGLRHQIRTTLAHLGFPILGDTLYGGEMSDRLFLHCQSYSLTLPFGRREFAADRAYLFDKFFY